MPISTRYSNNPNVRSNSPTSNAPIPTNEARRQAAASQLADTIVRQARTAAIDCMLATIERERRYRFEAYERMHGMPYNETL